MSRQKHIRTIDSFFESNRSQIDQRKNTEEEQCINEEETDGAQTKPRSFQKTWLRDHTCWAMKRRRCSAIFVGNLRKQTPWHRKKGVQILEPQTLLRQNDCKEHMDAVN